LELDLRLFAEGGLFVDNNLAEAELGGSLRFHGAGESVTWSGRVDVLTGEFIFRRRRFTITAGSVAFAATRPLNPDLEFRGETIITTGEADYEIFVHVSGTAKEPRVEFAADDPALTENDVLALVTFGRTVAQLQAQGAGIELTEVLSLTAGPRAGEVEERIYELLPVDRIEIQPTFSRTTGTTEPRLSVGKDLAEGLRAVLGSGLGAERQQDVSLEYQLTPRIAVQGVWESQTDSDAGAFGGDLKFRYPFRTFRQFSLLPKTARENP
jgi:autotransporter translocation and assembly factor TamB